MEVTMDNNQTKELNRLKRLQYLACEEEHFKKVIAQAKVREKADQLVDELLYPVASGNIDNSAAGGHDIRDVLFSVLGQLFEKFNPFAPDALPIYKLSGPVDASEYLKGLEDEKNWYSTKGGEKATEHPPIPGGTFKELQLALSYRYGQWLSDYEVAKAIYTLIGTWVPVTWRLAASLKDVNFWHYACCFAPNPYSSQKLFAASIETTEAANHAAYEDALFSIVTMAGFRIGDFEFARDETWQLELVETLDDARAKIPRVREFDKIRDLSLGEKLAMATEVNLYANHAPQAYPNYKWLTEKASAKIHREVVAWLGQQGR